jgi:hypothetical protein
MMQPLHRLVAVVSLVFALGLAMALRHRPAGQGPVYTVREVQAHLGRNSADWVGRTLRVRGVAIPAACSTRDAAQDLPCPDRWRQGIVDPDGIPLLPLSVGASNPLRAFVRHVPVLDSLAPVPQAVHWGTVATFRVRLRAAPANSCPGPPCYEAVLLDAAP